MIRFSFSSFYMSLFFANIMILFLYLIFRNQKLMIKLGLPMLSAVLCVTILRMLLPFEFLFFSHNVYFPENVSMIIGRFISPRFIQDRFSIWSFVEMIWFSGIIVSAVRFAVTEHKITKELNACSSKLPESSTAYRVFKMIQDENPKARLIDIRVIPMLSSPAIYGLWKPCILLPEDLVLNETELYYILCHEVSHYTHHDMYLKLGVHLLCTIYWWNPLCKFLLTKTNDVLEMRIDKSVAKRPEQKLDYLKCLIMVAEYEPSGSVSNAAKAISFCKGVDSLLSHRFHMLLYEEEKPIRAKIRTHILRLLLVGMFVLSFMFIFEASYNGIPESVDAVVPDVDNCYFIKREDGKYDLYLDGELFGTDDSIENYPDNIPIY